MTAPVRDPRHRIPDPAERFQVWPDWPCGCAVCDERGGIHPCEMHANLTNAQNWAALEAMFPDLELPEAEPPERPWPDEDEQC